MCGPSTALNSVTGQCEASCNIEEIACGPSTALNSVTGQCDCEASSVPSNVEEISCGRSTALSSVTGQCEISCDEDGRRMAETLGGSPAVPDEQRKAEAMYQLAAGMHADTLNTVRDRICPAEEPTVPPVGDAVASYMAEQTDLESELDAKTRQLFRQHIERFAQQERDQLFRQPALA